MYYLNHVGYKAEFQDIYDYCLNLYYLNHVGYKGISLVLSG